MTLRVIDRLATEVQLAGEHFWAGEFDPKEDPRTFPTHVYWGDLLLTERFDPRELRPLRETPSVRRLLERITRGEVPRSPASDAQPPAELTLEAPVGGPCAAACLCRGRRCETRDN